MVGTCKYITFSRLQPVNQNNTFQNFILIFNTSFNTYLEFFRFIDEELSPSGNDRIVKVKELETQMPVTDKSQAEFRVRRVGRVSLS